MSGSRSRGRPRRGNPRTLSIQQLAKEVEREDEDFNYARLPKRPKSRPDCIDGPRPCPWVGCRYNLYLDVNEDNGSIKFNFPDLEPHEMGVSCALDVAEEGEHTLDEIGDLMNLSRERIRQIEDLITIRLKKKWVPDKNR